MAEESMLATSPEVLKVGVKLPPFWADEPSVWFSQLECNFALAGITQDVTKFYYVVSQLENRYAAEIKDIIVSPPKENKYERLKSELIKRLSASREKEIQQLLMHEDLGDRRPSQFYRHLQRLAGPSVPEDFIRSIWLSRLPANIQPTIMTLKNADVQSMTDLADSVHELASSVPHVAATSTTPGTPWDMMARQISTLTKAVEALTIDNRRSRSSTRRGSRGRSSGRSQSSYRKFPVCWYHHKFGSKAKACQKPCDYQAENAKGGR